MPYNNKRRITREKSVRKHRKADDSETRSLEGDNNYSTDTTITLIYYYINER